MKPNKDTERLLTAHQLRELLHYDTKIGVFTWAFLLPHCRNRKVGDVAGSLMKPHGYVRIRLQVGDRSIGFYAHRLAWLYMTGRWPDDQVDHRNGVRNDNRWDNLREANSVLNAQNRHRGAKGTKTGLLGVSSSGRRKDFRAVITAKGQHFELGYFETPEKAHEVYLAAKRRLHEGCTI